MTVQEAGRLGGLKTAETHGPEFYVEIGRKGGQRMRELIRRGRELETRDGRRGDGEMSKVPAGDKGPGG